MRTLFTAWFILLAIITLRAQDAKMNVFISNLMSRMTVDEKIGQELKKFRKVFLKKGESKELEFTLTTNDLKFVNSNLQWIYEPGRFKVFVGGNSGEGREVDLRGAWN
jgi:hypothetical protein